MRRVTKMPARMARSLEFGRQFPKSVCTCGHTGDGKNSQHNGIDGHGGCVFDGGACCEKFSWKQWTIDYRRHMAEKGFTI